MMKFDRHVYFNLWCLHYNFLCSVSIAKKKKTLTQNLNSTTAEAHNCSCRVVCVCIPIPVTTFPEWLSGTEPHPAPCVRPRCVCSVLRAHAQFCQFDKADATADVQ